MSGLVELRRYRNPIEGEIARSFLEHRGLHVVIFDGQSFGYAEGAPTEVRLMVLEEDADDARLALASI